MTIGELFGDIGLPLYAINQMLLEISGYNAKHPRKQIHLIDIHAGKDQILIRHLPFLGRALAKVQRRKYLDDAGMFPIEIDENAQWFALKELEKYYKIRSDCFSCD